MILAGADWPRFRGPQGLGVSDAKSLPETWKEGENVAWKQKLPGPGASSPIVVGDKIFVTCYQAEGLVPGESGEAKKLQDHLICVRAADGSVVWDKSVAAEQPEQAYKGFLTLHGYSSGTPASDGKLVYVFFGRSGMRAYDLDGNERWHVKVGEKTHEWGSGTSPVLCGDVVIINASVESGAMVGLDKASGKQLWRAEGIVQSWSTPAVVDVAGGRQEVVVSMKGKAVAFDPKNGKKLWECETINDYVCPSVIAKDGVVYVSGGRKPSTLAIRAGGQGDVTKSHVLWQIRKAPKVPTPLLCNGLLYWVDDKGSAMCVKADNGQIVYTERLDFPGGGDKVYASLVFGDGKLYAVSRQGLTVVLAGGEVFRELARNDLGDKSVFNATPAVSGGQLLIRSDSFLYCVGK
jgi:outer membrane protein assembly factor BamB